MIDLVDLKRLTAKKTKWQIAAFEAAPGCGHANAAFDDAEDAKN